MQIDILLIGQGLAGSLLAWELHRRGYRILLLDKGLENASQVAAGLINPITGQRLVKQAEVETLLSAALNCYEQMARQFRQGFFVPLPMLKILRSQKERELAERRLNEPGYGDFLVDLIDAPPGVNAPFGVLQQRQTGYLQTEALLQQLRNFLLSQGSYRQTDLQYSDIRLQPALQWRDISTRHIVFCEGYQALNNPWFGGLPFQLAKGEILSCQSHQAMPAQILNFGHWLLPVGVQRFKLGASFDTQQLDTMPTPATKAALLASLQTVYPADQPHEVCQHRAGIRPTTRDKQPFIGSHPQHTRLHIFNGFGAKGSLAIPWYAARFADYLQQQTPLPVACDIRRYYDAHFSA